jgi:hypothetical protein
LELKSKQGIDWKEIWIIFMVCTIFIEKRAGSYSLGTIQALVTHYDDGLDHSPGTTRHQNQY